MSLRGLIALSSLIPRSLRSSTVEAIVMVSEILRISNPSLGPIDLWNLKVETWKILLQVIGKKLAMDRSQEESFW